MERLIGTVSRGVRAPIIRQGDDLVQIVADSVLKAAESEGFELRDKDVVAVTEAVVARAQGNYATIEQIAKDVHDRVGDDTVGIIFPITPEQLDESGVNPWSDVLTEERYRELFGYRKHQFTGVDYVEYYKKLIEDAGAEVSIIFANNPKAILDYTKTVLNCDIHTRARTKKLLLNSGVEKVISLDEILTKSVDGSGYNDSYGLLGSNKATEESVKLFPINCGEFVRNVQKKLMDSTGKHIEVMVYGDGAFKDPVGKIWELADPVVSPAYTDGLEGTPNEVKLKYLADNDFADLSGEELKSAISDYIREKDEKAENLTGNMVSQGTTPRRLTDLIGSLCDLTSGSGDKGTPIVLIQGYFDNYTK